MDRRNFLGHTALLAVAGGFTRALAAAPSGEIKICLGQWSFHRAYRNVEGYPPLKIEEFPTLAGKLGFQGVDYSGLLIAERVSQPAFIKELNQRASDAGVKNVLILVDGNGHLGAPSEAQRKVAIAEHVRWLDTVAELGGTGIRVNAVSDRSLPAEEQSKLVAAGVGELATIASKRNLDVLIENHGHGNSSDGAWIAGVVDRVNLPNCGTLVDFGNFQKSSDPLEWHDRYAGAAAMLPKAKVVCAKAHDFDASGEECVTDYSRMMKLVIESGFKGWIEVEYEGPGGESLASIRTRKPAANLGEHEGTVGTKKLVEKYLGR
jgi:L-ribulose-5-phosphate 3-epimerase